MICVKIFMYSEIKFQLDTAKTIFFPIDPHCKNFLLWQRHVYRHDVAKVGEFYNWVYGEFLCLCRFKLTFIAD